MPLLLNLKVNQSVWIMQLILSMLIQGPEGMEKFCEDLGVDPENVVMLVIAYKMGSKQMGYFTQEEWVKGMLLFF